MTRKLKAGFANILNVLRDSNASSQPVKGFSDFEHILGMGFFKSKKRDQKFAQGCQSISSEFSSIQGSALTGLFIDNQDSSEGLNNPINERFFDALNLKLHHIAVVTVGGKLLSFANKEASITINKTSQVNDVVSMDSASVDSGSSKTHNYLYVVFSTIVQYITNKIHRDRLSEWTPYGDAIVGSI